MHATRFVLAALLAATATAAVVCGFNAAVDPYLVFGRPRLPGFNQLKPAVDTRERLMKSYEATRRNPATLVLGSSRSGVGIDPASPAWPGDWQPVYNLSTAGAGLGTNVLYLEHLLAAHGPASALRRVVVGLDFETVLYRPDTLAAVEVVEGELRDRFAAWASSRRWRQPRLWRDHAEALLTLDALGDSLATVLANQTAGGGSDLLDDGRLADGKFRRWVRSDGVDGLFHEKNLATLRAFAPPRRTLTDGPGQPVHEMDLVQRLIDLAHRHRCTLLLAVQPSHVSRLELLQAMGYGPDVERWKRTLTAQVAAARAVGVDVQLWDFSGYEAPNTEPMPAADRRHEPLAWYWDPVHYRPALGELILRAMAGPGAPAFGTRLTPETVETRLDRVRQDRAVYLAQHGAQAAALRAMVCPGPSCQATAGQ